MQWALFWWWWSPPTFSWNNFTQSVFPSFPRKTECCLPAALAVPVYEAMVDILAQNVVLMLPLQDKLETWMTPHEQYRDIMLCFSCFSCFFFFFFSHWSIWPPVLGSHWMDFFPSVKWLCGLENITRANFHFWVNYPFKMTAVKLCWLKFIAVLKSWIKTCSFRRVDAINKKQTVGDWILTHLFHCSLLSLVLLL